MPLMLGRKPRKFHRNTLLFHQFLPSDAPLPNPEKVYWEYKLPQNNLQMFGNDKVGDCTFASKGHIIMNWTAHTGAIVIPTDQQILEAYADLTGYDPVTGANDNGAAMTDVNEYFRIKGIAGKKILGSLEFDTSNDIHLKQVIYLFGAADIGINLPNSAMDQFNAGQPWDVVDPDGGIDGGHDVPYFGMGAAGETGLTWAKLQSTGTSWRLKYWEEGYGLISDDWFDATTGLSPSHFNRDALWAAVKQLSK